MPLPKPPFQTSIQNNNSNIATPWQQWLDQSQTTINILTGAGVTAGRPTTNLFPGAPYFDTTQGQLYVWTGSTWISVGVTSGSTANRPADPYIGQIYFDTTQNQLFSWNGTSWTATGVTSGTTANRPATDLTTGRLYFDTTLGQLVEWTGSAWQYVSSGYYGAFYDTTNQTAGSTSTAYAITFNSTDGHWDVNLSNSSRINFVHAGVYNVQFSVQFVSTESTASAQGAVDIWLRQNGSDVAYSNSVFSVPNRHGSLDGALIAALNFVVTANANDYVQLMWHTSNTNVSIKTIPAGSSPTRPVTPSVILTAVQV